MDVAAPPVSTAPSVWPRLARTHLADLTSGDPSPVRGVIVGGAGSGASPMLHRIAIALREAGLPVVTLRGDVDIAEVPSDVVLLVDDAHSLDDAAAQALAQRAADPDAGLVLACRPWPQSESLRDAVRRLEASRPPIVLGHVTTGDVLALADDGSVPLDEGCVDDLIGLCGGAAWLVAEALALHGGPGCPGHADLARALHDVVLHRISTAGPDVRELVERACLAPDDAPACEDDDVLAAAQAECLVGRNGAPIPVIRDAVRAATTVGRLVELMTADGRVREDGLDLVGGVRDPRVARALLAEGDDLLTIDPARAETLYRRAAECGADAATIAVRRATALWALGRLDAAGTALEPLPTDAGHPEHERAVDIAAAVWAARGLMETSRAVYATALPGTLTPRAAITALATADAEALADASVPAPARTTPSALAVSLDLLVRGIRTTVGTTADGALPDLVRAAEMYTAAQCTDPVVELPVVVAAVAAINVGELDVACSVLDAAIAAEHGGAWARDRLVLWRAWVALQWQRPREVESALQSAAGSRRPLDPRDRLLADALGVGLARRHSDAAGLESAWRSAAESILRAESDVLGILPLGELVTTAARLNDESRIRNQFGRALTLIERLGSPPLWSAHLHWAGIQQGILLNRPDALKPHAKALVAAAPHSRVAAAMAHAGRVWTSVLSGSVDVEAVEESAYGLSAVGLAWDGARLAGHGAARTDDRRLISRLLACARQLHPQEEVTEPDGAGDAPQRPASHAAALSPREREVAALVLQGLTYAEIGETIYISPRTAEHHIARIRQRLGATSRSDLIAKLRLAIEGAGPDPRVQPRLEAV